MELTQDQIEKFNASLLSLGQGIFIQPYGIPVDIKGYVVYTRYETGGWLREALGWSSIPYKRDPPKDRLAILDIIIKELMPNISNLQLKEINALIRINEYTAQRGYGNSVDYKIEYIVLSELYKLIERFTED